jgi:hypothetical protein
MAAPIVDEQIPALIEDQQTGQRYWLVGAGPSARVYHAAALTCQGASITLRAFEAGTEPPEPPAPRLVTTQAQPKPKPRPAAPPLRRSLVVTNDAGEALCQIDAPDTLTLVIARQKERGLRP